MTRIVVAADNGVFVAEGETSTRMTRGDLPASPTCLAADSGGQGPIWCGTSRRGVFRSDDGGRRWRPLGLDDSNITAITVDASDHGTVWVGTEPSAVWRSGDGGETWEQTSKLDDLPSSSEWSFPPKPDTHHVRWIACDPRDSKRLWVAIEAGALISTADGGTTWRDRVRGGPWDTHELAVHEKAPSSLRVAAGDGYFESDDGGLTWRSPEDGLEVGYLRSVAIDPGRPDVVIVSASTSPRTAYAAGHSDGRIYRREGAGRWERARDGWPDPPSTIAPLLAAGHSGGELWAADERGVHMSLDGGVRWTLVAEYPEKRRYLRGLAVTR